jgi:hypothetical protein
MLTKFYYRHLADVDPKASDVLNDMREIGVCIGKGEVGAMPPESR